MSYGRDSDLHGFYDDPHFVTNFQEHLRPIYAEAVKRFGKEGLVLKQESYKIEGYGGSLWCYAPLDLTEFWTIFDRVKERGALTVLNGGLHKV